jgi:hypothetical protein
MAPGSSLSHTIAVLVLPTSTLLPPRLPKIAKCRKRVYLQDLLAATLEIPFSVPPYMSLLARSVATLEGIALLGNPDYQMVAQAYPFVVRKVLRNDSSSSTAILRDILFDSDGQIKPTRLSTLLNAALGFVADAQGGFIDFDSVPDEGATLREVVSFLLSAVRSPVLHQAVELLGMAGNVCTMGSSTGMADRMAWQVLTAVVFLCRRRQSCGRC